MDKIDPRTMIDDTRARAAALLQLIYFNDSQSMALLRVYVVVGVAGASGAAGTLGQHLALGMAFATAAIVATIGSVLCIVAVAPASLSLPGREPAFWRHMIDQRIADDQALAFYLDRAQAKMDETGAVCDRGARYLGYAKWCALAVPTVPLAVGAGMLTL